MTTLSPPTTTPETEAPGRHDSRPDRARHHDHDDDRSTTTTTTEPIAVQELILRGEASVRLDSAPPPMA